jgi:hypothetical protein
LKGMRCVMSDYLHEEIARVDSRELDKRMAAFMAKGRAFMTHGLSLTVAEMTRDQLIGCVGMCDDAAERAIVRAANAEKEAEEFHQRLADVSRHLNKSKQNAVGLRAKLKAAEAEVAELRAKLPTVASEPAPAVLWRCDSVDQGDLHCTRCLHSKPHQPIGNCGAGQCMKTGRHCVCLRVENAARKAAEGTDDWDRYRALGEKCRFWGDVEASQMNRGELLAFIGYLNKCVTDDRVSNGTVAPCNELEADRRSREYWFGRCRLAEKRMADLEGTVFNMPKRQRYDRLPECRIDGPA